MNDDNGSGKDGDPDSGLPPKAPAYDLRTGEPLDAPQTSKSDPDFTASDLGIWAPSRDQPGTPPPQYGQAAYQPTDPPGQPTVARQPTPPPAYGQTPPPGYGQPAPPAYGPTPPPGYGPTPPPGYRPAQYQSTSPQYPYGAAGYPPGGTAPTAQQSGQPPVPPGAPRRNGAILAACIGVLIVIVAVLVAVLAFGRSSKTPVASTSSGAVSSPMNTSGSAGPSQSGSSGTTSSSTDAARLAFLRTVDGILTQSATGRQQVSSVVTGVVNGCSVTPANASATIRQVIANRQSVLGQANALTAVDSSTSAVKIDLVQSLNASIEANRGYQRWLDNLYTTYFNADPVGCPNGQAPTDSNYDEATAASGRATAAKQNFVSVYNPLASAAGLRTWQESEF